MRMAVAMQAGYWLDVMTSWFMRGELGRVYAVFMLDGDTDMTDYGARKYKECKPYGGETGPHFNTWVRYFGSAMSLHVEGDDTLEDCMLGVDAGGDAWLLEVNAQRGTCSMSMALLLFSNDTV